MYNLQFVTTFTRVSSMAFTPCKLVLEKRGDIYQKRLKKNTFIPKITITVTIEI